MSSKRKAVRRQKTPPIKITALRANRKERRFRQIAIRVSEEEYHEVISRANAAGFPSVSSYGRSFLFGSAAKVTTAKE